MRIHDVVAFTAARTPQAVALHFEGEAWTYERLDDGARRLARGLRGIAEPGDRIAMLTENTPEYVLAYYGVPLAGMALVFVNYRLTPREVTANLSDSTPSVLITERKFLDTARAAAAAVPSVRTLVCVDDPGPDEGGGAPEPLPFAALVAEPPVPLPEPDEDAPAWLIYTSGTTGRAKGAVLTHRNVTAAVLNSVASWEFDDAPGISLMPWPLCHIAGYGVLVSHLRGETVAVLRRYDPVVFLETLQELRATSTTMAPTMLAMLLRHPDFPRYDTTSITRIGYGSAPMPAQVLREGMAAFPRARFQTGFGMTELAGNVLVHGSADHLRAAQDRPDLLTSVGKPMLLSAVRVVDEKGEDTAPDEVGELVIRGDQVCAGYWQRPDATAEAFRDGWFHSGDLARRDAEGYFSIVDRKKDMILTGGENVYSREVEEVLHQHPDVAAAAVVGQPDEVWGELVVAVIEPRAGCTPTTESIREFCTGRLAGYKRPRRVLVVPELPRNTVGKVLKRELRAQVAAEADDAGSRATG
ncbi:class I adenylate-forming enzyme family protein [Pseudonocardia lutea]|jgi:acyl-CoA synthetase (AMP-forming)/AMP-acid ligase II|uniref:Class I adenylate-forming enzyme family protein n=1 Tax=Pseudonocardia lutea TaxID=2172015 RepID=A0ABW1I639_9PSEU